MASNLWTDLEALQRLARTERAARVPGGRRPARHDSPIRDPFPAFPGRPGMELHALDLTERLASGDYGDFFFLSDTVLALVLADVSGKGVPAAVLRGVTRSVIRFLAPSSHSPGETLARANRILCGARLGPMFVTLYLGWYEVASGKLSYANAGHPVPYRLSPDGKVATMGEVTGPILGILEEREYATLECRLDIGDRLVLLTDGITEARSPQGDFFGGARLAGALASHATLGLADFCAALAAGVRAFQGGRPQDDATILALRRTA